ncbi:MAG: hypothetical protein F4213_16145, partial [Boseongicola sp. SB0677_bin_26]|nr:hypothetical protein [Boseongicola sp. SB0677_bin_26]
SGPAAQRPSGPAAQRPSGLKCARPPAGAQRQAPSTPAGAWRPDLCGGRTRLSLLLPVLALLLGALGPFAAAPAQAAVGDTVYQQSLRPDLQYGKGGRGAAYVGCDDDVSWLTDCSSAISGGDINFMSVKFRIKTFYMVGDRLVLEFNKSVAPWVLERLKLEVSYYHWKYQSNAVLGDITGNTSLKSASLSAKLLQATTVKQQVSVKLIEKAAPPSQVPVRPKPGDRTVSAKVVGDGQVALTWDNPNSGSWSSGATRTKYNWEYRQHVSGGSWSDWKPVQAQCDYCPFYRGPRLLHVVEGLNNGTTYGFQVKAAGKIDASATAWVTPRAMAKVRVTPGPGAGELTVTWSQPPGYWGGAHGEGYSVQWKSGGEGYDPPERTEGWPCGAQGAPRPCYYRRAGTGAGSVEVTRNHLSYTLRGLRGGTPHTVRVLYGTWGSAWRDRETWWKDWNSNGRIDRCSGDGFGGTDNGLNQYIPNRCEVGTTKIRGTVWGEVTATPPGSGLQAQAPERGVVGPPPGLLSARVNGADMMLGLDALLDVSSVPAGSAFAVSVAGASRTVSGVAISGAKVLLTLASAVTSGELVTVGYTPPQAGMLRASGGGTKVAAFSGQAVVNDTPQVQEQQATRDLEAVLPPAQDPLTASVAGAPSEHRGKGRFAVRVAFSAPVTGDANAATIQVTGGTLQRAARKGKRKDLWELRIAPSGHGDVTLTLPATADCAAAGAICAADGRKLESPFTHTVPGPVTLSVADARAREGEDATIDFAVTLSRAASGPVTVNYRTRNGTAKAGRDYTKASGTLTFAAGETSKAVAVTVLDDARDEGEETFRLLLGKPKGAVIADGEAVGTIANDDPMPAAWLARFGRTVAGQGVDAVRERLAADRTPGFRGRIAGEALPDGTGTDAMVAERGRDGDPLALPELSGSERRAFLALLAPEAAEGLDGDGGDGGLPDRHALAAKDAMLGTAFEIARETDGGLSLGLWGRVARSGFSGRAGDLDLDLDGEVTTAMLGTDWKRRD